MFAVSARHTNRGAKQFVEDRPIDLSREPSMPVRRVIDTDEVKAARAERIRQEKVAIEESLQRARRAAKAYQAREFRQTIDAAPISYREIERRILRAMKVTRIELHSLRRTNRIVIARQAIAYWTCRRTAMSLPEIGRAMGRDHTSVLWSRDEYPKKRAKQNRFLRSLR